MPLAPSAVEATATATSAPAPSPSSIIVVQEVTIVAIEVFIPATLASSLVALPSTVIAHFISFGVVTTSAPTVLPYSSNPLVASASTILAAVASPSSFSHPHVSLDHLYTFSDTD